MAPFARRQFLHRATLGAAALWAPGAFAEALARTRILTPRQTEGPFYPVDLPLDTDNDLLAINDDLTPAVGEVTYLSGRLLDPNGEPIRNAVIEIWQVDHHGVYLHKDSDGGERRDKHFQGFGRFLTGSTGEYHFRTIKPVAYPGRTPHIHFAIKMKGREKWTTQCYVKGEKGNETDGVLQGIEDPKQRESVIVDFAALPGSQAGELMAKFDLIPGFTPQA